MWACLSDPLVTGGGDDAVSSRARTTEASQLLSWLLVWDVKPAAML